RQHPGFDAEIVRCMSRLGFFSFSLLRLVQHHQSPFVISEVEREIILQLRIQRTAEKAQISQCRCGSFYMMFAAVLVELPAPFDQIRIDTRLYVEWTG